MNLIYAFIFALLHSNIFTAEHSCTLQSLLHFQLLLLFHNWIRNCLSCRKQGQTYKQVNLMVYFTETHGPLLQLAMVELLKLWSLKEAVQAESLECTEVLSENTLFKT